MLLAALLCGLLGVQCFAPRRNVRPGDAIASWPLPDGAQQQTDDDESTTYELLAPGSGEFHVRYEVSATTPGATVYYNILRKGSGVRDLRAIDLFSGRELAVDVVAGTDARENGHPLARPDVDYLEIELARPVPDDGQARIAIEKVYGDPRGYFLEDGFDDGRIVFARALNIRRNAIVLPPEYELTQCNHPTRVASLPDGRVSVSFDKTGQSPVFLVMKARPLARSAAPEDDVELGPAAQVVAQDAAAPAGDGRGATTRADVRTLAPDRELLIDLGDPRRGAFRAVHDFTESDAGRASRDVAPAPPGTIFRANATVLDTGETLATRVVRGARNDDAPDEPDVIAVDFSAIEPGCSARMRVEELRLDPSSYRIEDGELVWRARADSALRRMLLPPGWYLTGNNVPAVVVEQPDGRLRLDYAALSGDVLDLTVRARRRPTPPRLDPPGASGP